MIPEWAWFGLFFIGFSILMNLIGWTGFPFAYPPDF